MEVSKRDALLIRSGGYIYKVNEEPILGVSYNNPF